MQTSEEMRWKLPRYFRQFPKNFIKYGPQTGNKRPVAFTHPPQMLFAASLPAFAKGDH